MYDGKDIIKWKWGKLGNFSVRSVYEALIKNDSGRNFKAIWKGNIPNKIKIFLWLMKNNTILTKDNMIRRKCRGDPKRYLCEMIKNIDHLFFSCPTARVVWAVVAQVCCATNIPSCLKQCWKWIPNAMKFYALGIAAILKTTNKAYFENKLIRNPVEIIFYDSALMKYWARLYTLPG